MRFSAIAATAALVAGVSAGYKNHTIGYTTEVVTAYTTYCPLATSITHNGVTYTVTSATTLTITNCPCTITKPIITSEVTPSCYTTTYLTKTPYTYTTTISESESVCTTETEYYVTSTITPAPYTNATVVYTTPAPGVASSTAAIPVSPAKFTGAANKAFAASGAGLLGVFGVAAFIL